MKTIIQKGVSHRLIREHESSKSGHRIGAEAEELVYELGLEARAQG